MAKLLRPLMTVHVLHSLLFCVVLGLLATACVPITPPAPGELSATTPETTDMTNTTTSTTTVGGSEVEGILWQWDNTTVTDPSRYTIEFLGDGSLAVQADCDRSRGSYTIGGATLTISGMAITLTACPGVSQDRAFLEQLSSVNGFHREGETLVLTHSVDPSEMNFVPVDAAVSIETSALLTGTVTYRQRIALPSASVIEVQLQDVSKADAPAKIIASQTITTTGENVPVPFSLPYDPSEINESLSYALTVHITIDGQLRWINTDSYAVLTSGAPKSGVEVVVKPAQ
jgi:uncharacterized lipoprotein YbaY